MRFINNTKISFLTICSAEEAPTQEIKRTISVKESIWLQVMNFDVILLLTHLSDEQSKAES